jgi:hypothetical protein
MGTRSWLGLVFAVLVTSDVRVGAQSGTSSTKSASGFGIVEEPTKTINESLAKSWQENHLQPAERCSDYEFIRRASLDIIGRIATVGEIERYLKDPPGTRRALLLDRLLTGEQKKDYFNHWASLWNIWLMARSGEDRNRYRQALQPWLAKSLGSDNPSYKAMVEELIAAKGKSDTNGPVNFLLAHLGTPTGFGKQADEGGFDAVPITARSIRLFLGYQIQCTQCHDHPYNSEWKQKHYWGVNTFYRQMERVGIPLPLLNPVLELKDNPSFNKKGIVFYEKRNGTFLPSESSFVDGRKIPAGSRLTRREELARFVTSHANFNRAIVNRMWGHFFGRGMNVKPAFDDFGEHNEVVHDELLTKVGQSFAGSGGYDLRKLIKWICSSDAYNLKSTANKSNGTAEAEPFFSRMPIKMMSPEQLCESVITATRPLEIAKDDPLVMGLYKFLREQWMAMLVRNFGDDEGNEVTYNGTILQAMLLMNGNHLNGAIMFGSGTVKEAQKIGASDKTGKKTVDYLFLATLNRPATQREFQQIIAKLSLAGGKMKADGDAAMQDVFWALLNCSEFILNH